jgi:flavorubredoxin
MTTRIDEIADGIYRISTLVKEVSPPVGFTFNQFLIMADAPMLFHCGHHKMFPAIAEAVAKVMPLDRLRWLGFSHVEADECGALNDWLAAAPNATAVHGALGCNIWLRDIADRPPRALGDNETLDLGGKRVRNLDTPHLPHGWDAGLIYEETTGTLFCSDLFAHGGDAPALTESDIVAPGIAFESRSHAMSLTAATAPSLRRLATLEPRLLAVMHGSSTTRNAAASLTALAAHCEREVRSALGPAH